MRTKSFFVLAVAVLLGMVATGMGREIIVDVNGSGDYDTIQAAIDDSNDGDVIVVSAGRYTGDGNRDIDFNGKAITVRSTDPNDPNIVAATIIDCNGREAEPHRGFSFVSGEDANSTLAGFTITNGYGPYIPIGHASRSCGGAIFCKDSSPTITNCSIKDNSVGQEGTGGGISCVDNSSPTIVNCTIKGNPARYGGGIGCFYDSSPTITRCTISGNSATFRGGGITCLESSTLTIANCTVAGNSSDKYGGGIDFVSNSLPMTNCIISENTAKLGGGLYSRGVDSTITNCIFWGNEALDGPQICLVRNSNGSVTYSDIQDGQDKIYVGPACTLNWGEGNIDTDPCFVELGYWADANDPNITVEPNDPNAIWIEGDYHLLPTSPCIDSGDPNYIPEPNETDLDGKPRILDGDEDGIPVVDMGAYEYRPVIPAEVDIEPDTLNLISKGKWITCYIWLPEDYNASDIDPNSIYLEDQIPSVRLQIKGQAAIAKFSRSEVCQMLEEGEVELVVSGELVDGTVFEGTDVIRVISKGGRR